MPPRPASWIVAALLVGGVSCSRESPPTRAALPSSKGSAATSAGASSASGTPTAAPVAPATDEPADAGCGLSTIAARRPAPKRLIAIGDVHGDLGAARAALRAGGAIDEQDAWIGGDLVVVQVGDVLDRGDDEQAIFDLFEKLEREAAAAGGALVWLLGNHELMNAALDFRYVTPGARTDFDDAPGVDPKAGPADAPPELRGRIAALAPGGAYAKVMAEQNVWTIVGDTLFAHAGMAGPWTTQLGLANRSARCWLAGKGEAAPPPVFTDDEGPLWTRVWGGDEVDCDAFKAALGKLGVARMVVGHTVQASGANSKCDGALWRIDVGLSKFYGDNPIQVLEIAGDRAQVVTGKRAP
jgi:hypothetical protein